MANVNIRTQSSRSQVMQQPQGQGWLRRAISTVRDALAGPAVSTQGGRRGPDYMVQGAPKDVNSTRRLANLSRGNGGLKSTTVPDGALLPFLNDMSSGKYG